MPTVSGGKHLTTCGWNDVPHLDGQTKKELLDATPPYLREARSEGKPSLGAGAIYPIPLGEVTCDPFAIPPYYKRAYALDVGWNKTAALWGAKDLSTSTIYCFSEYYRGQAEPSIHATAVKARGEWIPGLIDPAARGRSQRDGEQLWQDYVDLGLKLTLANNTMESGLYRVWELLSTGRLKIFSTLQNVQAEYRLYRRDEDGKVVKKFDHLMDCLRYLVMKFDEVAEVQPVKRSLSDVPTGGSGDSRVGY